jgi:hypothetical protein
MEQSGKSLQPEEPEGLDGLERLIGKALLNAEFREYLLRDPAGAANEEGVELTGYQLARLESLDPLAMEVIAAGFERGVPMHQGVAQGIW